MFEFDYDDNPSDAKPERALLAEGNGTFKIIKADNRVSKAGNPMLCVNMILTDKNGQTGYTTEYITSKQSFKIKSICDAIGRSSLYSRSGQLNPNAFLQEGGDCVIKTEIPTDPQYKQRSIVGKYIKKDVQQTSKTYEPSFEDELPF